MSAQLKEKSVHFFVLKAFDKLHNQNNETSEDEALQLLSQIPNPTAVRDDDEDQFTLLHHACYNGWYMVTKVLIEKYNCNPKCKTAAGSIPLRLACWSGNLDLVKYLINEKRNDPKHKNNDGYTSIHNACSGGQLQTVKYLIEVQCCDPTCRSKSGRTLLHLACDNGHLHVVKYLVDEKHCDPTCTNNTGWTPLHSACQKGHLDIAEYLVDENGCDLDCTENDGWTPLLLACYNGHIEVVKYLIDEKHCDTCCATNKGQTPLHSACKNGHLGVALYLVEEKHCDPVCTTKNGWTPLHLACKNGHIHITKYLTNFYGLCIYESKRDIESPFSLALQNGHLNIAIFLTEKLCEDMQGTLPLHSACIKGVVEVVKFLIEDQQCDPQLKDSGGQTPLHLACEYGHFAIVQYLVDAHGCSETRNGSTLFSIAEKNKHDDIALFLIEKQLNQQCCKHKNSQWSVLHSACQVGDLEVIKFLVKHFKPHCKDSNWLTPLHIACESGHLDIVKFLIKEEKCDANSKTPDGISPLHLACRNGHLDLVVYLVSEHIVDLFALPNSDSNRLFEEAYAVGYHDIAFFLLSCGLQCSISNDTSLIQPALKVFVLGNPLTGKSTLIKAILSNIKGRGRFNLDQLINRKVTGVEPHTAGIIPYHTYSEHCGYVRFYDFAGQYEHYSSSHAAVLEKLRSADGTLVLIVVDISKTKEELVQQLQYWNSFLNNQYEPDLPKPPVIVIGSHADIAKSNGQQVLSDALNEFPDLTVFITLNCTQKFSTGLKETCTHISTHSQRHYHQFTASTQTHFLNRLLNQKFNGQVACQMWEILDSIAQENSSLTRHKLLPTDLVSLSQQLSILSEHGQIIFLNDSRSIADSWVVFKKELLLSDLNGSIFAPENFHTVHKDFSSTGIVALSKVKEAFPNYDPEMLVNFMTQLDFCFEVDKSEVTLISGGQYHTANVPNEKYYFFPGLVSVQCPTEYCQIITKNWYKFGWCLQCKSGQCFTSRFLHILLLHLAFNFALPPKSPPTETHLLEVKHRECNIWKNGIHWQNTMGVETIVEVVEQNTAVLVTIGCSEESQIESIKLRSAVIQTILSTKEKFSGATKAEESILHPDELINYPLKEVHYLYTFPMSSLATAIQERGKALTNKTGPDQRKIEIKQLLHFEPYTCLTQEIIVKLIEKSFKNEEVSDVFLRDCARVAHPHLDKLKEILLLPEHDCEYNTAVRKVHDQYSDDSTHKCFHIFRTWTKFTKNRTYRGLKEALDKYSIFCGRNPLSFAVRSSNGGGQSQI